MGPLVAALETHATGNMGRAGLVGLTVVHFCIRNRLEHHGSTVALYVCSSGADTKLENFTVAAAGVTNQKGASGAPIAASFSNFKLQKFHC